MLGKLLPRSIYDVMAAIACFGVLAGGTAYAANTVFSSDIVDGEVGSADIKDNSVNTFDVHSFLGVDVVDGTLSGADIADNSIGVSDIGTFGVGSDEVVNDSLLQSDIRAGAVTGDEVLDNSLTGADINEGTLAMPPTTTATFASTGEVALFDAFTKVSGKNLPAGTYAVVATANIDSGAVAGADLHRDAVCELRNGAGFIGGAVDRRRIHDGGEINKISLSMNGGAQVPAGGGEVSLWCRFQGGLGADVTYSQMMIIRLDGFF